MRDINSTHVEALVNLLKIIQSHGLDRRVSIHLVHKHFDIADNKVMVYETVHGKHHPDFILSTPRKPQDVAGIRGLYFKVCEDILTAYEFTTDACEDLSSNPKFLEDFCNAVKTFQVEDVFALTAKPPQPKRLVEFELPEDSPTILVDNPSWLPDSKENGTSTDWIATEDVHGDMPPGIIQLKCLKTKAKNHYNVTCSRTRGNSHYEQKSVVTSEEKRYYLSGELLSPGSEAYAIADHAQGLIEVM